MSKKHRQCQKCGKDYYGQGKMYCSNTCRNLASKGKPQKKRSEESKLKMSIAKKGFQLSDIHKTNISKSAKKVWQDDEYKKRQHDSRIGRIQSEETKGKIRQFNTGIKRPYVTEYNKNRIPVVGWKHTSESRKKISEKVSKDKNGMYGKLPKFNKPTTYTNGDIEVKMRSTWEVKFAEWLDANNRKWEYETHTFSLSNGTTYTPDFFSDGIFYEVKGYFHDHSKHKINLFMHEYPDKKIEVANKDYLIKLGIKL